MKASHIVRVPLTAAALVALVQGAAFAEMLELETQLSGANEVPPNDSGASGSAQATLDTETGKLTYKIMFEDLSGPVMGAHLHGPVGESGNAGILVPFESGESPIEGEVQLSETQIGDVTGGLSYVNIHTEQYPGGELRGQLKR
ncbi:MAG: CHRD domain-containing protein [Rhizobiaceae bacterium]